MEHSPHIHLIDKPKGVTSFFVVRRLRKKFDTSKIGHAGTLDPLASGLMIVGVGVGTKLLKEYVGLTKEYVAEVRIGERRSTGDLDGEIVESVAVPTLETHEVVKVLTEMYGRLRLAVPLYSAVKKGGVPFYRHVRRAERQNEVIQAPVRDMEVYEAELIELACAHNQCVATIRFVVGSGTYIRSLGEELGRRLGYPATLQNLRRTKVGDFLITEAEQFEP